MKDLNATIELQQAIWQMQPYECVSPYTLNAVIHNGGGVLGAEIDGQLVGFCFAFPSKRGNDLWLWSHMTGVRPGFQGQQIGFQLKQVQKNWALENGYHIMGWTFDPIQRGNAHFNFNQLGIIARTYYVDHYGEMTDGINAGLASDRLEAYWRLDDPQLHQFASDQNTTPPDFLVYTDAEGELHSELPTTFENITYAVEIPYDIAGLKQVDLEKAKSWQLQMRRTITLLLDQSFIVSQFIRDEKRCWYVLRQDIDN